ncbi:MAG: trypsin-like peptidase domain-containing protein [Nitrospirae bacterium]|nr:trypsin-like peptidase domain-containing protein [Nitrospirota bacterium]
MCRSLSISLTTGIIAFFFLAFQANASTSVNPSTTGNTSPAEPNFTEIASKIESAVIPIIVTVIVDVPTSSGDMEKKEVVFQSGTGFVISSDGYILTCKHVIEVPKTIKVPETNISINPSGSIIRVLVKKGDATNDYRAQLVQTSEIKDVAIIKINAQNLQTIEFGDSSKIKNLQKVLVMGYPLSTVLGVKNMTLTTGAIAAIRERGIEKLIQITASVNPGNSGGPLIDENGKAIGIIEAKIKEAENINFAVPINEAKALAESVGIKTKYSEPDDKTATQRDTQHDTQHDKEHDTKQDKEKTPGFINSTLFMGILAVFVIGSGALSLAMYLRQRKARVVESGRTTAIASRSKTLYSKPPIDDRTYGQSSLLINEDNRPVRVYSISNTDTDIGRNPSCDVILDEQIVSGIHASVKARNKGFYLYNMSKTNKTYLNGKEVTNIRLEDGDKIKIGNTILEFRNKKMKMGKE